MTNPTSDQLNDPEGRQLVNAIHVRKAVQDAVIDAMIEHGPDGHIDGYQQITDAALKAAAPFFKPQQVTTAEELDKLGFQAVVLDAYGTPYVCERHRTDGTRNEWKPSGMDHLDDSEAILYHGPATVIHVGDSK